MKTKAVMPYVQHLPRCVTQIIFDTFPCTCGLNRTLNPIPRK